MVDTELDELMGGLSAVSLEGPKLLAKPKLHSAGPTLGCVDRQGWSRHQGASVESLA